MRVKHPNSKIMITRQRRIGQENRTNKDTTVSKDKDKTDTTTKKKRRKRVSLD